MPPSHKTTDESLHSSFVVHNERTALHSPIVSSTAVGSNGGNKRDQSPLRPSRDVRPPRRRSVGFIPNQDDLYVYEGPTEEEQEEVWYSRDEYDIIKARNALIVQMMRGGTFEESEEHTFRGLEHKLKEGYKKRRANKFNALNAVLEEQDSQYAKGRTDPDSIAEAYRLVSLHAKESAFLLGSRDAEDSYCFGEASSLLSSPSTSPRRSPRRGKSKKQLSPRSSPRKSPTLSDLLQNQQAEEDDDTDAEGSVTDLDTVGSESTAKRKNRLRKMFGAVSLKRKDKLTRRTSL
jgi:hypothetical protein